MCEYSFYTLQISFQFCASIAFIFCKYSFTNGSAGEIFSSCVENITFRVPWNLGDRRKVQEEKMREMKISDAIQYVSLQSTAPLYWSVRHSHKSSGFQYPQLINIFGLLYIFGNIYSAQCAVCTVQWPCGILAIAVKTLSQGKLYF